MWGQPSRLFSGRAISGRSFLACQRQRAETFPFFWTPMAESSFEKKERAMLSPRIAITLLGSLLGVTACNAKANPVAAAVPAPAVDAARTSSAGQQTAVLAGGCF